MDITLLPDHIFIEISKFLTPDDLYSCSLVNAAWRDSVNRNEIWRYMCKINVVSCKELDLINTFLGTNSFYSTSDLEPLCEWRTRFMKWVKLKQNWERGVYKHYKINEHFSFFNKITCDDDRVMVVHHSERKLSVWCIKQEPSFLEEIHFCLTHFCAAFVKLCNNLLVVVQCNLLQVFRNEGNEFKLSFRSLFNKQNFDALQLPSEFFISEWYKDNVKLHPHSIIMRCDHNGEKFVGIIIDGLLNSKNVVLHIWDFVTMTKDAEEVISNLSFCVDNVRLSISENYLYILVESFREDCTSVHVYDLKLLNFLDFNICYASSMRAFVTHNSSLFIIGESQNHIHVWKVLEKSETIMGFNFKIDTDCLKIMNSHLLISGPLDKCMSIVSVYRVSDLKQVFNIRVNGYVKSISMIHYKFLVIKTTELVSVRVYDIPKQCFLYTIPVQECLFFNSINSKIVTRVKNKLNLVNFLN